MTVKEVTVEKSAEVGYVRKEENRPSRGAVDNEDRTQEMVAHLEHNETDTSRLFTGRRMTALFFVK